jgi:hypothetical protein
LPDPQVMLLPPHFVRPQTSEEMSGKMVVALLVLLPAGAMGVSCAPGSKMKTAITGVKCTSPTASTAACGACCTPDTTKCGGNSITCGSGKYLDPTKAGNVGTTAADCCSDMAKCKDATCSGKWMTKASAVETTCAMDASSCVMATCCKLDATKCGGNTGNAAITCGSGKYLDPTKTDNAGTAAAECCTNVAMCKDATTCTGSMKKNSAKAETACSMGADTCSTTECCEPDMTLCGAQTLTCDSGTAVSDVTKTGTTKAECCIAIPTVTMATCDAFATMAVSSDTQKPQTPVISLIFAAAAVMSLWK